MSEYISTYSTLYLYSVNTFVLYICKTKSYVKRKRLYKLLQPLLLIYDYLYEIAKQSYYFIITLSQ